MTDAETERKAIVAWHRKQAVLCGSFANAAIDPRTKLASVEIARLHAQFANSIERGAHLNPETSNAG